MKAIIVFGDSIVHGRGESPSIGWVGRLKEFHEGQDFFHTVYNLGISGNDTNDLLQRFDRELKSRVKYNYKGDRFIVILAIGINDARADNSEENIRVPIDRYKQNIKQLIVKTRELTEDIVLIGLTLVDETLTSPFETTFMKNDRIIQYNNALKELASEISVNFINLVNHLGENWRNKLCDGVHPNSEGYNAMYEIIKQDLLKNGIIQDKRGDNKRYQRVRK